MLSLEQARHIVEEFCASPGRGIRHFVAYLPEKNKEDAAKWFARNSDPTAEKIVQYLMRDFGLREKELRGTGMKTYLAEIKLPDSYSDNNEGIVIAIAKGLGISHDHASEFVTLTYGPGVNEEFDLRTVNGR